MKKVFVDSSVWIEYFSGNSTVFDMDFLIDDDNICINEIILCELIPFLKSKKEDELVDILTSIDLVPLKIDWNRIIEYQTKNVDHNIKRIGIPDLLIMQNVIDNDLEIYTLDKHFLHLSKLHKVKLFKQI